MLVLRKIWLYFCHFIHAKTLHGTHSPFVYGLLEKVVYGERGIGERFEQYRKCTRVEKLVLRLAADIVPNNVFLVGNFSVFFLESMRDLLPESLIRHEKVWALAEDEIFDFVYIDTGCDTLPDLENVVRRVHRSGVCLFSPIYDRPATSHYWRILRQCKEVTVTIDLFYAGLVFFHDGQVKENFTIRMK